MTFSLYAYPFFFSLSPFSRLTGLMISTGLLVHVTILLFSQSVFHTPSVLFTLFLSVLPLCHFSLILYHTVDLGFVGTFTFGLSMDIAVEYSFASRGRAYVRFGGGAEFSVRGGVATGNDIKDDGAYGGLKLDAHFNTPQFEASNLTATIKFVPTLKFGVMDVVYIKADTYAGFILDARSKNPAYSPMSGVRLLFRISLCLLQPCMSHSFCSIAQRLPCPLCVCVWFAVSCSVCITSFVHCSQNNVTSDFLLTSRRLVVSLSRNIP